MSLIETNCETWTRLSKESRNELKKNHYPKLIEPEECKGVKLDNDKYEAACVSCSRRN